LKKQLGGQGRIEEAMLVQQEMDSLTKIELVEPGIRHLKADGLYSVKYKNTHTREFKIEGEKAL
jgi:hypothetical protein